MTATERDRLIIVEQKLDAILDKMDSFTKGQQDHEQRIRSLEGKPVKQYDAIKLAIITSITGTIIGAIIGAVFAIFVK